GADAPLVRDLFYVWALALEAEGRVARDNLQRRNLGEISRDVLADPVAEIFLFRFSAHVHEWQDAYRHFRSLLSRLGCAGLILPPVRTARLPDCIEQFVERLRSAMAIPWGQIDRVELAEAERRFGRTVRGRNGAPTNTPS